MWDIVDIVLMPLHCHMGTIWLPGAVLNGVALLQQEQLHNLGVILVPQLLLDHKVVAIDGKHIGCG